MEARKCNTIACEREATPGCYLCVGCRTGPVAKRPVEPGTPCANCSQVSNWAFPNGNCPWCAQPKAAKPPEVKAGQVWRYRDDGSHPSAGELRTVERIDGLVVICFEGDPSVDFLLANADLISDVPVAEPVAKPPEVKVGQTWRYRDTQGACASKVNGQTRIVKTATSTKVFFADGGSCGRAWFFANADLISDAPVVAKVLTCKGGCGETTPAATTGHVGFTCEPCVSRQRKPAPPPEPSKAPVCLGCGHASHTLAVRVVGKNKTRLHRLCDDCYVAGETRVWAGPSIPPAVASKPGELLERGALACDWFEDCL